MLGASPALLQGKIIRGGMGTGMPYWGPIFTEAQTWALVDYPGDTATVMDEIWRWAAQPNIGRRVVFDARLAMTLRYHGVTEFATRNEAHFAGFGFARVWNPLPS
jgi:hypothetical protein